jgi:hypothetical protein
MIVTLRVTGHGAGWPDRLRQLMDGERQHRGCSRVGEQSCRHGRPPSRTNCVVDKQHRAREAHPRRESDAAEQILCPYGRGSVDRRRGPADRERVDQREPANRRNVFGQERTSVGVVSGTGSRRGS